MPKLDDLLKLASLLSEDKAENINVEQHPFIGKKVIVRTYAAGVHFGEIIEKEGKEVILKNSRRLWYWKTANNGISLSEVSLVGLHKDSKVCSPIESLWLEAVEIIPCTKESIKNIEGQNEYKA